MKLSHLVVGLSVVAAISAGQIIFKLTAISYQHRTDTIPMQALWYGATGLFIYGVATIAWIYLLRFVPLNAAYPIMALAFVIVPCLSALILGEPLTIKILIGSLLIIAGVVIANR